MQTISNSSQGTQRKRSPEPSSFEPSQANKRPHLSGPQRPGPSLSNLPEELFGEILSNLSSSDLAGARVISRQLDYYACRAFNDRHACWPQINYYAGKGSFPPTVKSPISGRVYKTADLLADPRFLEQPEIRDRLEADIQAVTMGTAEPNSLLNWVPAVCRIPALNERLSSHLFPGDMCDSLSSVFRGLGRYGFIDDDSLLIASKYWLGGCLREDPDRLIRQLNGLTAPLSLRLAYCVDNYPELLRALGLSVEPGSYSAHISSRPRGGLGAQERLLWRIHAARQGHRDSQYALGDMFYNGKSVERSIAHAVYWFTKSAKQGHVEAQVKLNLFRALSKQGSAQFDYNGLYDELRDVMNCSDAELESFRQSADRSFIKTIESLVRPNDFSNRYYYIVHLAELGSISFQCRLGGRYRRVKNHSQAAYWYRKAAEQGNAEAQFVLGLLYEKGEGVAQNFRQAEHWFRKAAGQGFAAAQCGLGTLYCAGQGVRQNFAQAEYWYRQAADQGLAAAQCGLGTLYCAGQGVRQDFAQAAHWFRKAADHGYARAQRNLGTLYRTGQGVRQDFAQAAHWFRKAADHGYARAQRNLGTLYRTGQGVGQDFAQAAHWYRKAADQGIAEAQLSLAELYACGEGVRQDFAQAAHWCRQAADQGLAGAQCGLGSLYYAGEGVRQDFAQAEYWFRQAADHGYARAQFNLGNLYRTGQGAPQSFAQAAHWYRQAADHGYASAQHNLGTLYRTGQGVRQDFAQAAHWCRKAADQGLAGAQYNLGILYVTGQGVAQDSQEARELWSQAAAKGDGWARNALALLDGDTSINWQQEGPLAFLRDAAQDGWKLAQDKLQELGQPS